MATSVSERAWCVVVPHHPRGAGLARRRLASELAGEVPPEMLADVITVVAELVGNSIRHASGLYGDVIRVAWSMRYVGGAQIVDVRVTDGGGSGSPHRRVHDVASPDGRGMAIVEALATTWGVDRDGLGQCVWAEVTGPISSGRSVG